ncbi:hypothetical protein [Herbaspirillum huttiense]|uniref:Uncharacterized protein n=1 Tax=Herbaspirillum huttiense subsp. lycopersici TaxID=3074428 RepID=A0ABU2EG15_9BURK|nr:hypothetical protein [Herbaspirillum huttiense]MDR9847076.1 hypothetical protein [Herbaspirillum huttiense SE1]
MSKITETPTRQPAAWRIDWPASHPASVGGTRFVGKDDPGAKDRLVSLGATAVNLFLDEPGQRPPGEVIAWAVVDQNGSVWNVWRTEPSKTSIRADHIIIPLCAASDFSDSEPAAWLQIGLGDLHEGTTLVRLTKPERYDHTWWRFEPLFTRPAAGELETRRQIADPGKAAAFLEQYGKNLEAAGFTSAQALKACQIIFDTKVTP